MEDVWLNPDKLTKGVIVTLKQAYWESTLEQLSKDQKVGSLTEMFLSHKSGPCFQPFLDRMHPAQAKKLYMKFRIWTIPLNSFTSIWGKNGPTTPNCPFCQQPKESTDHFLFFCPIYIMPCKKWILPVCKLWASVNYWEASRIFRCGTKEMIVFSVSRFLLWAWRILATKLKFCTRAFKYKMHCHFKDCRGWNLIYYVQQGSGIVGPSVFTTALLVF